MDGPLFLRLAIAPALSLLPASMDSPAARAMLLAIALQESKLKHRRQIKGPAHGFFQFEQAGVRGVLNHPSTKPLLLPVLAELQYAHTPSVCYLAIEDNDVLASVFARLLLWTIPERLPKRTEVFRGWQQYLEGWRPGKPHKSTWDAAFHQGWETVDESLS